MFISFCNSLNRNTVKMYVILCKKKPANPTKPHTASQALDVDNFSSWRRRLIDTTLILPCSDRTSTLNLQVQCKKSNNNNKTGKPFHCL